MTASTSDGQANNFRLAGFIKALMLVLMTSFVVAWYLDVAQISGIKNWIVEFCEQATNKDLLLIGLIYVLLLTLPFIPGVELGIMIMITFCKPGILFAYLCTVIALCLAYATGTALCKQQASRHHRCSDISFDAHTIKNILQKNNFEKNNTPLHWRSTIATALSSDRHIA